MNQVLNKIRSLFTAKRAYILCKDEDDYRIVFLRSADEIDEDEWESVDRAPEFDKYRHRGFVPVSAWLEAGWGYDCWHCGKATYIDRVEYYDEEEDDWLDKPVTPIISGQAVYCSQECYQAHRSESYDRHVKNFAYRYQFQQDFPGAYDLSSYQRDETTHTVEFRFPGSQYKAHWYSNDPDRVSVCPADRAAFEQWKKSGYGGYFGDLRYFWKQKRYRFKVRYYRVKRTIKAVVKGEE